LDGPFEGKFSALTNIKIKYGPGVKITACTERVFFHRDSRIADGKYVIVIGVAA